MKPCHLLLTCSAFLLAVERMPEYTFESKLMQCSSVIQTSSADRSLSCSLVTWVFSPGVKQVEDETDDCTPFSVQFKKVGAIHLLPFVLLWREQGKLLEACSSAVGWLCRGQFKCGRRCRTAVRKRSINTEVSSCVYLKRYSKMCCTRV